MNNRLLDGKEILIVDDEPDVLDTLEQLLSMCKVTKATTFEDGKRLLETRHFDLAILDIMGVNGYELLRLAYDQMVTAVMLTAHALSLENTKRSYREGAAFFIPKDRMGGIATYLIDVFEAKEKGVDSWQSWYERFAFYYDKKFGEEWQKKDRGFWEKLAKQKER
jgi:DNA-binding NtrC family response regulator